MQHVRAICNDSFAGATSTPGEGQIITDTVTVASSTFNNPFTLNHLNSALRELYRKLRVVSAPCLIKDNYILTGLEIVNGPLGLGVPDPTVQTFLDAAGYWNGSSYDPALTIPPDMIFPLRLWERVSGSTDPFDDIKPSPDGLSPSFQGNEFHQYEWLNNRINFKGALTLRDVRIRYAAILPTFFTPNLNFAQTFVPVIDCDDYVAYKTASKIARALGPGGAAIAKDLDALAGEEMQDLRNERVRQMQGTNYHRQGYNDQNAGEALDQFGI